MTTGRIGIVAALALVLVMAFGASPAVEARGRDGQVVPGQFIVLLADGADPAAVAADHGVATRHVYRAAVNGFAGGVGTDRLAGLRGDPRVLVVEAERLYRLEDDATPTGIDRIEADKNPNANGVTVNLDVAIIDSGIDEDHPDLNVAGGRNFAGGPSSKWNDGNGHGTHTAGTVGAKDNGIGVIGVAPGVRVWAVRVCKNGGICSTGDMVAGINWVAAQKSSGATNFAAANMSITTGDDANACTGNTGAVHEAICGLVNEGVVFALAAGNNSRTKNAYPEALAVSAIADFDGKGGAQGSPTCRSDEDDTLANFSNFGPEIDIAAPGACVLSTYKDGRYATISGTSMASPHAAGAMALYLHANSLSPASDGAGVDAIESAIIGAALAEGASCSYTNERGSTEPLLFVNGAAFGGDGTCDVASGPVDDETPPVISGETASNITASSADITWTTDEDADSRVDYGETEAYGLLETDLSLVTNHSVSLTGLAASTTYHVKVTSVDGSENLAFSDDFTLPPKRSHFQERRPSWTRALLTTLTRGTG